MHHDHHDLDLDAVSVRFLQLLQAPRHTGELESPAGRAELTRECGDSIAMHIAVTDCRLTLIRVRPRGCAYMRVCAEAVAEMATGLRLDDIMSLDVDDVVREVDGLPEEHLHCATLALKTLGEAVLDYLARTAP